MNYAAVIFDLDGTLIDSEPVFKAVAKRAAVELDRCFTDELYLSLVGLPGAEVQSGILAAFGQDFPLDEFRRYFETHWREHVGEHGIAVKSGALALIDRLCEIGIPYAIATSTPHERAQASLRLAGLDDRFQHVIGGDQVANGKPAPDIYLEAANAIAVSPLHCIAIEDSAVGVRAASAAKMYTIMVPDLKAPDARTRRIVAEVVPSMDAAMTSVLALVGY
jgi:HAD superfamily hydrolase (TIGR01509 family)